MKRSETRIGLAGLPVRYGGDFVVPNDPPEATVAMAFAELETWLILWGLVLQGQVFISLFGLSRRDDTMMVLILPAHCGYATVHVLSLKESG